MKRITVLAVFAFTSVLYGQGLAIGPGGSVTIGLNAGPGNYVSTTLPGTQVIASALVSAYHGSNAPVTFSTAAASYFGYGQISNEADIYCGAGGCVFWAPNGNGTAWQNIGSISQAGVMSIPGNYTLLPNACVVSTTGNKICDDNAGGWALSSIAGATNGVSVSNNGVLQWKFDPTSACIMNGAGVCLLSQAMTGVTGSGNIVLSISPTLVNPVVGTQLVGDSSTLGASTQFVARAVANSTAGVASINGQGGTFTFAGNVTCTTTTGTVCTFTSTGIANVQFSLPSGLVAAANSCYGYNTSTSTWALRPNSGGTQAPATFSHLGVSTSPQSNVWWGWVSSPGGTVGWGKVGGMEFNVWASAANTDSWEVCNQTAAQLPATGTVGTPTFIISAQ